MRLYSRRIAIALLTSKFKKKRSIAIWSRSSCQSCSALTTMPVTRTHTACTYQISAKLTSLRPSYCYLTRSGFHNFVSSRDPYCTSITIFFKSSNVMLSCYWWFNRFPGLFQGPNEPQFLRDWEIEITLDLTDIGRLSAVPKNVLEFRYAASFWNQRLLWSTIEAKFRTFHHL